MSSVEAVVSNACFALVACVFVVCLFAFEALEYHASRQCLALRWLSEEVRFCLFEGGVEPWFSYRWLEQRRAARGRLHVLPVSDGHLSVSQASEADGSIGPRVGT